jgi:hypothetical protein
MKGAALQRDQPFAREGFAAVHETRGDGTVLACDR